MLTVFRSFGRSVLLIALLASGVARADDLNPELRERVTTAIEEGLNWLADQQRDGGAWSNENFPALSALPLEAFAQSRHPRRNVIMDKACEFIMSNVQEDGGIYRKSIIPGRGGLSTYNTAVCVSALHATGEAGFTPVILKARRFIAQSQLSGNDEHAGGFGYGQSSIRRSSDLMVSMHAIEAMYVTRGVEDLRAKNETRVSLDVDHTRRYIEQMQNSEDAGPSESGGFFYGPGKSGAGKTTNTAGEVVFRSYGSMTYAGMLALIYADAPRTDPRAKSAFDWAMRHWTLEENPNLGDRGMFFFYNVLAKALDAYGINPILRPDATPIDWKTELAEKLLSLQTRDEDGKFRYWVNENGRYWENNPVLVSAYAILALQRL
ncbi:MAG: terpene cyclase/mutase family protein [Verrucomicrobia bacterium]|nr:terpene cyclase/mutase family protein [Verrucomicrobiota bacterium]